MSRKHEHKGSTPTQACILCLKRRRCRYMRVEFYQRTAPVCRQCEKKAGIKP